MTDLDTTAYTPAHETEQEETEDEETEEIEVERTRFQIQLDQKKEYRLQKTISTLEQQLREDKNTEIHDKIQEIRELLDQYDSRKYLKMVTYKCRKCEEEFDTKQGAGVHRAMNPNCDRTKPWTRSYDNLEQQFETLEVTDQ